MRPLRLGERTRAEDHFGPWAPAAEALDEIHPVHPRHPEVQDDHVGPDGTQYGQCLVPVGGLEQVELALKSHPVEIPPSGIVVNEQYAGHGGHLRARVSTQEHCQDLALYISATWVPTPDTWRQKADDGPGQRVFGRTSGPALGDAEPAHLRVQRRAPQA